MNDRADSDYDWAEDSDNSSEVPSPQHDASIVEDIVARIEQSDHAWKRPRDPIALDGKRWLPYLVSTKRNAVLHVHISGTMPRYVARRLRSAGAAYRVYVALTLEALYDEAVLKVLADIGAEVIVVSADDLKPAYYLAAVADNGIPIAPALRRELAMRCWEERREGTSFQKGRHFEGLLAFLLSQVNGFRIADRNFNGETDEIDIVIRVDTFSEACWSEPGVPFVIVEAKNRADTIGSNVVTLLIRKLETRRGRARIGLLFATSGFSPEAETEEIKEARGNILVAFLGPDEIEEWIKTEDLTAYLDRHIERAMLR